MSTRKVLRKKTSGEGRGSLPGDDHIPCPLPSEERSPRVAAAFFFLFSFQQVLARK